MKEKNIALLLFIFLLGLSACQNKNTSIIETLAEPDDYKIQYYNLNSK